MELLSKALAAILRFFGLPRARPKARIAPTVARPLVVVTRWSGAGQAPSLTWKECHPRTRAIFKAELTCSNGHSISLRRHSIAADGKVFPSVVCMSQGCDFHDFVILDGWTAGAV